MMTVAIWPTFLCTAVVFALVSTPAFALADTPPTKQNNREVTLDGLRGFLALAVFFHHAAIYQDFLRTDAWEVPNSTFYAQLGPFGVSLFFMITGYLFYGKLVRSSGKVQWTKLYVGRVFRIGPLYLLVTGVMLLTILWLNHFHVLVPWRQFFYEAGSWLNLGIWRGSNSFDGYKLAWVFTAGVTWSVHFEWIFYFMLPFLALATRWRRTTLMMPALGLILCLAHVLYKPSHQALPDLAAMGADFMVGMITAVCKERDLAVTADNALASLALTVVIVSFFFQQNAYTIGSILLLGIAFYLIVCGSSLWGLLRTRAAKRLGDISYGIYLMQGLVLAGLLRPLRNFANQSPTMFWCLVCISSVLLVGLATLAHVAVERPGVKVGMKLYRRGNRTNA